MLAQFGNDLISTIVWFLFLIIFVLFGPRLMVQQAILKLEREAVELEGIAERSMNYIIKSISKKGSKKIREAVKNFMEFFIITPVDTDPFGVMKKLDHVIRNSDERFKYFVKQIIPQASKERQKNIKNALGGAITTYQIAKIVRHYLELIKKYKLFQLAVVLQMQIPLIARMAKASQKATEAFTDGIPVGDGIGSLVAASFLKGKVKKFEEEEFVVSQVSIDGRKIWVAKADGPGASTGYPGKFLTKFLKKNKINRIITVDAKVKLEGEKTGSVAEGVGVAMGGVGVDRYEIEEIAVKKKIPLDAIAIKMSDEEALMPMSKEVFNSLPKAVEAIKKAIKRAKKNEKILLIGVGNTCGIKNSWESVEEVKKIVKRYAEKKEK